MAFAQINGVNHYYEVAGSGPPLVWVMGTGMAGAAWSRYQVPAFCDRYRCITYDLRGIGQSECPSEPYTPEVLASDLAGLLDVLGIEDAHMVGFSLGSVTIQELALVDASRVKSAVLLSTWSSSAREHHIRRHFESRRLALAEGPTNVFGSFAFWMWSPTLVDEEHDRIVELESFLRSVTGGSDASGFIGHFDADLLHDTYDRLPRVSVPVTVVHGSEDLITRPAYNESVAKRIPNARLVEIPRAGHLAYLEQPDAVNAAVSDHLGGTW